MSKSPSLQRMIQELCRPGAFPEPVGEVRVEQTHISVVFLTGSHAYKIKKGLDLGFLDFTTLEKRKHFCLEEVALNRPRAPGVYLGVVPVTETEEGLVFGGSGEPLEYAVRMRQLPSENTLRSWLARGELSPGMLERVAARIASLHGKADRPPEMARFGAFQVVAFNARENFSQSEPQVGVTVTPEVFERFRTLTEDRLQELEPLMEERSDRGMTRDTHGDLHLDHVYVFPEESPSGDILVVDCIEFNERFRFADPMADIAFLAMDLIYQGREDLKEVLMEAYFDASGDEEGRALLPFYVAYRAAVRGKVEGFAALQEDQPEEDRAHARGRSRAHWMVGLGALELPGKRPCAILVSGLPGTGKTTLGHRLEEEGVGEVLSSDEVRKRLSGLDPHVSARADFEQGLYTPERTEETYAVCLRETRQRVLQGERVMVDATFRKEQHRRMFVDTLVSLGVPVVLLQTRADPVLVRKWMASRREDASDAYWEVHQRMAEEWEDFGDETRHLVVPCDMGLSPEASVAQALEGLRCRGLQGEER